MKLRIYIIAASIATMSWLPLAAEAQDYPPRVCASAVAYAGAPLRSPSIASAFAPRPMQAQPLDPALAARLDAAFERARVAVGAQTMSAAVMLPRQGLWRGSYPAASPTPLQYWASAGKAFTAVAILQLVAEGKLSLNDPVSRWIAGVPNGDAITIKHLLNHTSGLFSANEDARFRRSPHRLETVEEVRIIAHHGAIFCPGENWHYSNSGYALLGAILEHVEQKPLADIISDRVVRRLGDVRMRVILPNDPLSDIAQPAPADAQPAIDPRTPGSAGAIASDAAGMIAFLRALLGGELLPLDMVRAQFAELYPMFGSAESYGLGIMVYELPEGEVWLGHSGGAPGVKAVMAYSVQHDAFVAVALSGDGSAEASANLLLSQLDGTP